MVLTSVDAPWGIRLINWISGKCCSNRSMNNLTWHKGAVLGLTYLAYMSYHMSRKPISVVKNVLNFNCSTVTPPSDIIINDKNRDSWCDWSPFDTDDASALLGILDSAFLIAYAAAMFLSGFVAERVNLRYFLSLGMMTSGISCYLFGIAKTYDIHSLWYFIAVQAFGGVVQTTGWPGVVTVVGNWFEKGKRGLIFGVWNSHTSLGNIFGNLIAAKYVEVDWSRSFIVPGILMCIAGFIIFLFLAPNPTDVGCISPKLLEYRAINATNSSDEGGRDEVESHAVNGDDDDDDHIIYRGPSCKHVNNLDDDEISRSEMSPMLPVKRLTQNIDGEKAIGFAGALRIPGVLEFSFSLFFAKLVSYTFLYWLPLYIKSATNYNATFSANISTVFDVGGIIGAIIAGILTDYSGMSALTCTIMLIMAIPMLFIYDYVGSSGFVLNICLLMLTGALVNGPYSLITTTVSAELGTHPSLGNNSKALATVTAIIDGTGSIGAAVGPLLAGIVSRWYGWHNVFYMLMVSDLIALLLLSRLVYREIRLYRQRRLVA